MAVWSPYRLTEGRQPAAALLDAAAAEGLTVRPKTAGPSNIGNLLAGEGIPATAGFGVRYEGLHRTDERACVQDLPAPSTPSTGVPCSACWARRRRAGFSRARLGRGRS
jgi:succinyl-diaminopimelate desuccinylase